MSKCGVNVCTQHRFYLYHATRPHPVEMKVIQIDQQLLCQDVSLELTLIEYGVILGRNCPEVFLHQNNISLISKQFSLWVLRPIVRKQ